MNTILVANAGSSSVKFQVFGVEQDGSLKRQIKGQMDGVGSRPRLRATAADGSVLIDRNYENEAVPDVAAALTTAGAWLRDDLRINPIAVGHRVVHGGPDYDRPVRVDKDVVAAGTIRFAGAASPTLQPGSDPVGAGPFSRYAPGRLLRGGRRSPAWRRRPARPAAERLLKRRRSKAAKD